MGYNDLWSIFEETGDVEDYLDYVNDGEYYSSNGISFIYDDKVNSMFEA